MIGKKLAPAIAVVTVLGAAVSFGGAGTAVATSNGAVQLSALGVPASDGDFAQEVFGRCQHPIVDGSGTGVFDGVSGRLDFKDVISESGVNSPMMGHLRFSVAD